MRHLILVVAILGLPASLNAQRQQGTPAEAARASRPSVTTAEALGAVRGRLLLLVEAQEAHFADHASYTRDLVALQLSGKGKVRSPVVLDVTHAGKRGWRAAGWHSEQPGKSCVIFVGKIGDVPQLTTKSDRRTPTVAQDRQPVCDEP